MQLLRFAVYISTFRLSPSGIVGQPYAAEPEISNLPEMWRAQRLEILPCLRRAGSKFGMPQMPDTAVGRRTVLPLLRDTHTFGSQHNRLVQATVGDRGSRCRGFNLGTDSRPWTRQDREFRIASKGSSHDWCP